MVRWFNAARAATLVLGFGMGACGASASDAGASFASPPEGTLADAGAGRNIPGLSGDGAAIDAAERKLESSYQSPVATGTYVWVANPSSGRVAYIKADTLDVATVDAGDAPTYLAAVPDPAADVAIVLNVLSHDATLLRAQGGGLTTKTFPVAATSNAWAVSADGRWAVAWGDATKATNPDPTQGFQDLGVLDLTGQTPATILAVGYRPVKVAFASDDTRAFAVTQDGISVIDLTLATPLVVANYATSTDPLNDPGTHDVSFTPDGAYALVRRDGHPDITIVTLKDGTLTTVTLPANASDLTLTPGGDEAVAVMRDTGSVALLPIPGIVANPTGFTTVSVTGSTVGRAIVTAPGQTALLFTTAVAEDRLTVLSLVPPQTFRTLRLYSPVLAVFPTDDAANAIVLHDLAADAGTTAHGAFSIVPIGAALPAKIVGTSARPNAVAVAPSSDRAVVTVRDDASATYGAYLAKMPSLEVDPYVLASPPIAAGVVAGANRAFIAQEHPEGRITFIDLATGEARTLTGFELGARVVDGSQP
jgi:hypothetical protein